MQATLCVGVFAGGGGGGAVGPGQASVPGLAVLFHFFFGPHNRINPRSASSKYANIIPNCNMYTH